MQTISISELQKSPKQALQKSQGFTYIFSHNQKNGGIVNNQFVEFIESNGILDLFEDWLLANNPKFTEHWEEGNQVIESQDFSSTKTFNELWPSN
jgi:hypothetical protein